MPFGYVAAGVAINQGIGDPLGITGANKGGGPTQQSGQATEESILTSRQAREQGQNLFDYHTTNYRPLEQQAIKLAGEAGSPESQDLMAAQAGATVQKSFTNAADARRRALTQLGSKPDSGNVLDAERRDSIDMAGATSGAMNLARQNERVYGLTAKKDVAALGRNLVSDSTGAYNASANAAAAAVRGAASTQNLADNQSANIGTAIGGIGQLAKSFSAPSNGGYSVQNDTTFTPAATTGGAMDQGGSFTYDPGQADFSAGFYRKGGLVKPPRNYAKGGKVTGPGTGTSDSVPVVIDGKTPGALSSGEYVLNAKATKAAGLKKLDEMNLKGLPKGSKMRDGKHLADGGIVDQDAEDDDDESEVSSGAYARGGVVRKYFARPVRTGVAAHG